MSDTTYTPSAEEIEGAQARLEALTPEDLLGMELYQQQLEDRLNQLSLAEAPGSVTGLIWSKNTGNSWQVTARGASLHEALDNLIDGVGYALEHGFLPQDPNKVPVTHAPASVPAPAGVPAPSLTTPLAGIQAAPAPTPQAQTQLAESGEYPFVSLVVTPQAGEKVKLEFFHNDRGTPRNKYPYISGTLFLNRAVELLSPLGFTDAHLRVAQEYAGLSGVVAWKKGKPNPNSKDGFYKDIVSVRPA